MYNALRVCVVWFSCIRKKYIIWMSTSGSRQMIAMEIARDIKLYIVCACGKEPFHFCTLYSHVQMHFKATCSRFLEIKRSYVLVHPTKRSLLLMGFKIFLQESITSEKIHITKNEWVQPKHFHRHCRHHGRYRWIVRQWSAESPHTEMRPLSHTRHSVVFERAQT